MTGIEVSHCNAALEAVLAAFHSLLEATVTEALRRSLSYGKGDTLGLDAIPEIAIVEQLEAYDRHAILITEERGAGARFRHLMREADPRAAQTFYISDPLDASIHFQQFLEDVEDKEQCIGPVVRNAARRTQWEERFGAPATITGASSAITCVRRGVPIFAVLANYFTQQLIVSCRAGSFVFDLPAAPAKVRLEEVRASGTRITFPEVPRSSPVDERRFTTYLGKRGYLENFLDSGLMGEVEMNQCLHAREATGPPRVLYLSSLQPAENTIGFVLANGEKLGEWIHWLPFTRFARRGDDDTEPALRLFEIYQDRPWTKDGVLMATPPAYSIFTPSPDTDDRMKLDVRRFADFENPSKIRSTLLVARRGNLWATRVVKQHGYRPIQFADD